MRDLAFTIQIIQLISYILGVFVTIGGGIYFVTALKTDIRVVKHDMVNVMLRQTILGENIDDLKMLLTKMAVQDQRLTGIEEDIRDIKHGRGFIKIDNK